MAGDTCLLAGRKVIAEGDFLEGNIKMNKFEYIAKDKSGSTVTGILEGASENEVSDILHKRDLIVISIKQTKSKAGKSKDKKIKLEDLVIFSRQLATMIDAGIPLVQALNILVEQVENANFKQVIVSVYKDLQGGMNFCEALAKHPNIFSDLFINMSRAGEISGKLDEVLDRLAIYLEKTASLNRKVRSSLVYPSVVVTMAILITALLLIKVVPTFKNIFDTLGGQLPLPTQILIGISEAVRRYLLVVVGIFISAVVIFKKYISTEKGRFNFDVFKLRMPVLGQLFQKVAIAKFSRTFATLIKSGVAALNALEIVAKTSGNKLVEKSVLAGRDAVRSGELISATLLKNKIFPSMVCRMIAVGEQTGQLEKMLSKIADFYDEQVDTAVAGLTSLIEPMVIAFLGVVIGGIVISLFLPIFKITELIGK
ncbi:MAG: type II secretion system F family protein [Candidatus Omnitrophota bacterium]